ncbi:MAG: nuclear transport factor 2 family protein [Ilumatobacteraceae bacterium]
MDEQQGADGVEIVRRIYADFAAGGIDAIMGLADPDIVITQDPALPWGGRFVGTDGVAEFVTKLVGTIESAVEIDTVFAAGDRVVQHGRTRGTVRANGAAFDVAECHVWTVRDGRVLAADFFVDSATMLAAIER